MWYSGIDLQQYFVEFPGPHRAVVESTGAWYWLADVLAALGVALTLAHATRLTAIAAAKVKTDQVDSDILALLLRADRIPVAHMIAPGPPARSGAGSRWGSAGCPPAGRERARRRAGRLSSSPAGAGAASGTVGCSDPSGPSPAPRADTGGCCPHPRRLGAAPRTAAGRPPTWSSARRGVSDSGSRRKTEPVPPGSARPAASSVAEGRGGPRSDPAAAGWCRRKPQRAHGLSERGPGHVLRLHQVRLIRSDLLGPQVGRGLPHVPGKGCHAAGVAVDGAGRVIPDAEIGDHPLAQLGHDVLRREGTGSSDQQEHCTARRRWRGLTLLAASREATTSYRDQLRRRNRTAERDLTPAPLPRSGLVQPPLQLHPPKEDAVTGPDCK